MAINFSIGEYLIINRAYVRKVLATLDCDCNAQTLASLGYIGESPAEVLATGTVPTFTSTKSFIRLRPTVSTNPANNSGTGTTIYFCSDAHLNNSFELSTAFIADKCFVKAQNVSGSIITKGQLVYQSGFDGTLQLPNIDLASASAVTTCAVLGLAAADVGIGECGSVLVEGSFVGLDTSAFANIGATVYLSNTPGEISDTPGTNEKVVARVMSISMTDGTIIMDSVTAGSGGGGGGFFSDGSGTNAGIGKGTVPPTAAGENSLAQGDASVASGNNSLALGDTATAAARETTALGTNVSVSSPYSFAHGRNISIPAISGYCNFATGYNHNITGTFAHQNAIFGRGHDVSNPYDALVFGYDQDITNCYGTVAGGYSNTITAQSNYALLLGTGITGATINNSLHLGVTHTLTGTNTNNLSVGRALAFTNNENCAQIGYLNSFANNTDNSLAVGRSNTVGFTNSFALGRENNAADYNSVAMGRATQALSLNNFAFGSECRAGYGDYPNNVAFGGYYVYADGYNSQAFGYYTQITPGSAYSTALGGFATTVEARNCLAHGKTAGADIIGQRAFSAQTASGGSSAGSFPFGPANAQWSFVAHSGGLGNPSTTISIPTDTGRAYSFMVNIVMNATTGDANRGSFVVSQMLAHNSAGTATIVGSPSFTAITDGADIANVTTSITASGANVQFVFTRNAATLFYTLGYWISFIETDT